MQPLPASGLARGRRGTLPSRLPRPRARSQDLDLGRRDARLAARDPRRRLRGARPGLRRRGRRDALGRGRRDSLLKAIEEPGLGNPRHFLLLAPSRLDLSATLRSRSLPIFLGPVEPPDAARVEELAAGIGASLDRFAAGEGALYLLDIAGRLAAAGDWSDPRAEAGWTLAASAVRTAALAPERDEESRRRLLELAEALLVAPPWRLRGISAERILEGLASRHLAPLAPRAARPTDAPRRSR